MRIMRKKAQALLSVAVLLCLTLGLMLAGGVSAVSAAEAVTLTLSNATVSAGGIATVTLSMSEVSSWGAAAIHIVYDNTKMTCLEATPEGAIKKLDMPTAVIDPARAPSQVWLSGISANSVSGGGQIMTMKFQLKAEASGTLPFTFAEDTQMLTGTNELMAVNYVSGSVTVDGTAAQPTAATEDTASGGEVTQAPADGATTTAGATADTPATDVPFTMPTDAQVPQGTVGLAIGKMTVAPGGIATVQVGMTQVDSLGAASIKIAYDTSKMVCLEATPTGFFADSAKTVIHPQRASNEIWLTQMSATGISGGGAILTLKFQVYSNATGTVPLTFSGTQELVDGQSNTLSVMTVDGEIKLEGTPIKGNNAPVSGSTWWISAIIAGLVIVVVIVAVAVLSNRRKARRHEAALIAQAQLTQAQPEQTQSEQTQSEQAQPQQAQPQQTPSEQPSAGQLDDDDEFKV